MNKNKKKLICKIVRLTLSAILFTIAILIFAGSLQAKKNNEPFQLFGLSSHIVVTDSMTGVIDKGDFVLAKKISADEVQVGDDIIFRSKDPALKDLIIIHRAVKVEKIDGKTVITTQGMKPGTPIDEYKVEEVFGKKIFKSAFLGKLIVKISSPFGLFLLVLIVVFAGIAICQTKKIVKLVNLKKEKAAIPEEPPLDYDTKLALRQEVMREIAAERGKSDKPSEDCTPQENEYNDSK